MLTMGLAALVLAACGVQRSSLPPPPAGASGFVPLARLARYPEVYVGASLTTIGTLRRVGGVYALSGPGVRRRIEVYPLAVASRWQGRRVEVSGTVGVTFQTGFELTLGRIVAPR
jgi:hypothetical protein